MFMCFLCSPLVCSKALIHQLKVLQVQLEEESSKPDAHETEICQFLVPSAGQTHFKTQLYLNFSFKGGS